VLFELKTPKSAVRLTSTKKKGSFAGSTYFVEVQHEPRQKFSIEFSTEASDVAMMKFDTWVKKLIERYTDRVALTKQFPGTTFNLG